jgi:hypothetical protein
MRYAEITRLDDEAAQQHVDAVTCLAAWEDARADAVAHAGGMVWKHVKGRDYLVRTSRDGAQKSLGPRSDATERLFESFFPARHLARARLAELTKTIERHQRLNRALRVGRVPNVIVELLAAVQASRHAAAVTVVGPAALYAYEAAAGARFDARFIQRRDMGQPQCRHRIALAINESALNEGALELLASIDPSFDVVDTSARLVRNVSGVVADLIVARDTGRPTAQRWQGGMARDLLWLASAPRFSEVVIGVNGSMARMHTVDPRALVLHLDWVAVQGRGTGLSGAFDIALAEMLERCIEEYLPHLDFVSIR